MRKVKWGIIGTGNIASEFARDLGFSEFGELTAVASRSDDSAKTFADRFNCYKAFGSYEALYQDHEVEAIYVATPHTFHFKNASDALKAGKPVLCEKPISINPEELKELLQIAEKSDQYLMEGMWMYFLPTILRAQEWINEGRIGEITQIKADFGFPMDYDPNHRMFNPKLAGGAMLDIGIYPIAFNWLIHKKKPSEIIVMGRKAPTGVDNDVSILFKYRKSTSILSCSFRSKLPNSAYIAGTLGSIEIPNFWMSQEAKLYKNEELIEHFKAPRESFGFNYQIDAVSKDIRAGKKQSDIMPHEFSMKLQEQMKEVLDRI